MPKSLGQALAEGTMLGLYRFLKYKTGEENGLAKDVRTITLLTESIAGSRPCKRA